jgi:hypothetical protein
LSNRPFPQCDLEAGKPLAHQAGVYGNSTVVLEKQGNRYILL